MWPPNEIVPIKLELAIEMAIGFPLIMRMPWPSPTKSSNLLTCMISIVAYSI